MLNNSRKDKNQKETNAWKKKKKKKHVFDKDLLDKTDSWFLLTNITKKHNGRTLYRIMYTKDILGKKTKGTLGGWAEKGANLSSRQPFLMDKNTIIMAE